MSDDEQAVFINVSILVFSHPQSFRWAIYFCFYAFVLWLTCPCDRPICPQPDLPYPQYWKGPLPPSFPVLPLPTASELDCLNLNITAPNSLLAPEHPPLKRSPANPKPKPRVPVLVFFHGGALVGGSQSIQIAGREIYDPTSLVRTSCSRGQAIIVVTANYRLGPLGFLAASQLVEENLLSGPAGNYGLHDQRRALQWCSRFIEGFGGDPRNITIQGSSAGGLSCHYHCLSPYLNREDLHERDVASIAGTMTETPLFRRAILASGSFVSNKPMPLEFHQRIFEEYIQNIRFESRNDPVAQLREIPVDEFLSYVPAGIRWCPFADQVWLKEDILSAYRDSPWPKPDIMIGTAKYEVGIVLFNSSTSSVARCPVLSHSIARDYQLRGKFCYPGYADI